MRALLLTCCCAVLAACPEKKSEGVAPAAQAPGAGGADVKPQTLTLLITGSENGYLLPSEGKGGAAELLGQWLKSEGHCLDCKDASTLVLSTGDNGNGAAISSVFHGEPAAAVMKHMGYSASAFGNHEVDFGRPQFARNRETGGFPYLAANLPGTADSDSEAPLALQAATAVKRGGLEVGVIGLTSAKTRTSTMPGRLDDVTLIDDVKAMEAALPTVANANARVVLTDGCLSDFAKLLEQHPEWKVTVVAGHACGDAFPPEAGGAKLVATGQHFEQYARAVFKLEGGKLQSAEVSTVEVKADAPEPKAAELINEWKKKLDAQLGERIGFSKAGLEAAAPQLGKWLATALKEQHKADVGLVNAKSARQALPKGPITKASVYDLIPFENSVVVVKVKGDALAAQLKNPEARFVGPKKLDAKKTYSVATNNFVFFGGDGFALQGPEAKPVFTGEPWQTTVIEWTKKKASSEKKPLETMVK